VKRFLGLALGVMTAIGGFVDIGNLVTSGVTGARFGLSLVWALAFGTLAMTLYGEMAGRVTAVARRPVFHLVRERLGVRMAMVNLAASLVLNVLTVAAELGGVGLALYLASSISYILWVPIIGFLVWFFIWRIPFGVIDKIFGLLGLALVVFVVALVKLHPDWHAMGSEIIHPTVPAGEGHATWFFYAISLIGACVVPYQAFFFSSGAIEEGWSEKNLLDMRMNALIGFPLGGALSLAIMAAAVPVLEPRSISVNHLGQVALPVASALGTIGVIIALVGFFAATFAAAVEAALSSGYIIAQYFGWSWGKFRTPAQAPRFHAACLITVVLATGLILTTIDPVKITVVSVVLGAAAIPLTFFPVIVVANDREYMGKHVNKRWVNVLAMLVFCVLVAVSVATLPLLFWTKAGQ
jgi:Mn2+/Fe2+ NRAMP family transporter